MVYTMAYNLSEVSTLVHINLGLPLLLCLFFPSPFLSCFAPFFGQLNTKFHQHRPDSKFIDSSENFLYGFQSVAAPRDWILYNFGMISLIRPSHKAIHDLCGALQLPQEFVIPTKMMCH